MQRKKKRLEGSVYGNMQGFSLLDIMSKNKKRMNEMNAAVTGIVEMLYNCLFYGVVGNYCLQDVGKLHFAFPCVVNIVIHDGIGSYAHFRDAF